MTRSVVIYYCGMPFDVLLKMIRRTKQNDESPRPSSDDEDNEALDPANPYPEPVIIEFSDVLDLHSIPPPQVRAVVEEYLEEAHRRRVRWVRIIHGKGIGVQREMIRSILSRTPFVIEFQDAPGEAGGWGATVATLRTSQ